MIQVAVVGATGQLGTDVVQVLGGAGSYKVFPLGHKEVECTNLGAVREALAMVRPDIVVNCAAYVHVDECEDQPGEAFRVNAIGALHVARVCADLDALCVYASTDYVFDGEKSDPYTEGDPPGPINVYGASKLAGECLVRQSCPRWLIVRMASLFGEAGARGKGGNFVEAVLAKAKAGETIRVVSDIHMSPTYTSDAAWVLEALIQKRVSGLFHLTNKGGCTWYDFACKVLELTGLNARVEPTSAADYPARARRPKNSVLRSLRLHSVVQDGLPRWEEALKAYLDAKGGAGYRR